MTEILLHELKSSEGSRHRIKRLGRGTSSGKGKTAGKGTKGQNARTGGGTRPGFEGGQTPAYRKVVKRGFTNFTTVNYAIVNLKQLNAIPETDIDPSVLVKYNVIKNTKVLVKILGTGTLENTKNVLAHKFSEAAKVAIANSGGKTEVL